MHARQSIEELQRKVALRLPLKGDTSPELPEDVGYREIKSRNGRVLLLAVASAPATVQPPRHRSPRELALAQDRHHRRREAARKRALRAGRRVGRGMPLDGDESLAVRRWIVHVPHGPTFDVFEASHKAARQAARAFLGLARRTKLPPGTYCIIAA